MYLGIHVIHLIYTHMILYKNTHVSLSWTLNKLAYTNKKIRLKCFIQVHNWLKLLKLKKNEEIIIT